MDERKLCGEPSHAYAYYHKERDKNRNESHPQFDYEFLRRADGKGERFEILALSDFRSALAPRFPSVF